MQLHEMIPDAEALLQLSPEELAPYLLRILASKEKEHRTNVAQDWIVREYPPPHQSACKRAIMEAWQSLVNQGLLAPDPGNQSAVYFVSRRGLEALEDGSSYDALQKASLFPRASLHPSIASETYPLFLQGKYDTAVFEAFRAVEIAVREAGGFGPEDLGVSLMRKAFPPGYWAVE